MVYLSKNLKNAIKYVKIHFINIVTAIFMTGSILIKKNKIKSCVLCAAPVFKTRPPLFLVKEVDLKKRWKKWMDNNFYDVIWLLVEDYCIFIEEIDYL